MRITTSRLRSIIREEIISELSDTPGSEAIPPLVAKWSEDVKSVKMGEQPPPDEIVSSSAAELEDRIETFLTNAEEKVRKAKETHDAEKRGGPASSRRPGVKESKAVLALKQFIRETIVHA